MEDNSSQCNNVDGASQGPKLLDRYRGELLARGHLVALVEQHVGWARQYILFHGKRHPQEMGGAEVRRFLDQVGQSQGTGQQAQARLALETLYRDVLGIELNIPRPQRLLDQVHEVMRVRHYALRTEERYANWIKRFILFHQKRHPLEMGGREIEQFLRHLGVREHVAASTQTQALCALVFLYRDVLGTEVGELQAVRASRPQRLPVVLSRPTERRLIEVLRPLRGRCRLASPF
jgi:hypothetical protein